jgi:hypothetical protein
LILSGNTQSSAMKFAGVCVLVLVFAATVSATLNPSKNKKGKQKTEKVVNIKINKGPQEKSVYDRNLVDNEPLAIDIIRESQAYFHDTSLKNFNGSVLGYVTPVIYFYYRIIPRVFVKISSIDFSGILTAMMSPRSLATNLILYRQSGYNSSEMEISDTR